MSRQSLWRNLPWGIGAIAAAFGALGLFVKSACAPYSWGSSVQTFTSLCYSDVGPLYFGRGLAQNLIPYFEVADQSRHVEYPVLTGLQMWLANYLSGLTGQSNVGLFVYITWLINLALIALAVMVFAKLRKPNSESTWWLVFAPATFFVLAINWDALPVLAVICAFYFWQKEKAVTSGLMIAIGTAAKLFPVFLLPAFLLDALRKRDFLSAFLVTVSSFGFWALINAPVYLNANRGWWEFYDFSKTRGIDFGSIYLAARYLFNFETATASANLVGLVAVAIASLFVLFNYRKLNFIESFLILLGTFLLFNKVYSPQYWLWLTPVIALAVQNRWHWILWNFSQLIYFVGIWRYLLFLQDQTAAGAIDAKLYSFTLLIHWTVTFWIIFVVARNATRGSNRLRPARGRNRL